MVGKWKFTSELNGDIKERTCTLQQQESEFRGTCSSDEGAVQVTGTVNADAVSFTYPINVFGQPMPVSCSGTRTSSSVVGSLTLGPLSGACRLKRVVVKTAFTYADRRCQRYLGRSYEGATITRAELLPAEGTAPETCVVRGEMPQDLDFELRMPTRWNRRTVFIGGGGFAGSIGKRFDSAPAVPSSTLEYATIATNHGHNEIATPGASFALNAQMLEDYAHLAVPRVLAPARAILRAQYGKALDTAKMVYEGCSGGGRQGMIQAQRYPELFDGIIARAPATSFIPQFLWYAKLAKLQAAQGGALTPRKIDAIGAAVRGKCDELDGLQDGIISRPELCSFDPAELACTSGEADTCLTPPQVATARGFYEPTSVGNGQFNWPGFMPGGEQASSWLSWQGIGFDGFMRYFVAQDATADPLAVDPEKHLARLDYLSRLIDPADPDLHRFKAHGGKLILWTGQADWLITSNNATAYYQSVVEAMGGQKETDEFMEYYTSPDVQHCGGGAGPDRVDLVTPMFEWLEKGTKPSAKTIVARQSLKSTNPLSRPLCRFPRYPKYLGGEKNSAGSFSCALPDDASK